MTLAHARSRIVRMGAAMVLPLVLLPAPDVGAAGTDCSGVWRFEVARPTPDKEAFLSPQSWCRAARLPRTFVAEFRPDAGDGASLRGTPLRPTDIMVGGGHCEFQYAGPEVGAKTFHELTIEVNASGAAVQGKARCSERTRTSATTSNGLGIDLEVTGTHTVAVDTPERLAGEVVAACRQRDAAALWKMLTPRFRSELDARATQVRRAVPAADLGKLFGHRGPPATFKGLAFLRHSVEGSDGATNPCWGAEQWALGPSAPASGGAVVPVQYTKDRAFGLRFTRSDRDWQLDQITKTVPAAKP